MITSLGKTVTVAATKGTHTAVITICLILYEFRFTMLLRYVQNLVVRSPFQVISSHLAMQTPPSVEVITVTFISSSNNIGVIIP